MPFDSCVDFDCEFPLMKDEKGGGVAALFHEILSLENFAKLKFLNKHVLQLSLFDQG